MTGKYLIECFWQKESNCAAIVLLKAAILRYGLNRVFRQQFKEDHFIVTLKDKTVISIASKDVDRINKKNRIQFRKPFNRRDARQLESLKRFVQLGFAIMVRKLQLTGYLGEEYTESKAVRLLTMEGMNTDHIHKLLGLPRKTTSAKYLSRRDLRKFVNKKSVLLYSDSHIVVVSNGYYEDYGKAVKIADRLPVLERRRARGWFELK